MSHPDPLLRPLAEAPLPDSFGRTADWLRTPRPRRRTGRTVAVVAGCVLLLAACTLPVEVEETVGYALLWTTDAPMADAVSTSRTVLGWLREYGLLGYRVERESERAFRYRIAVAEATEAEAEAWRDRLAALPDVRDARIESLEEAHRRPLYAALASELKLIPPADNPSVKMPVVEEEIIARVEPILAERGQTWEMLEVLPLGDSGGYPRVGYRIRWPDEIVTDTTKEDRRSPKPTREDVIRNRRRLVRGLHEMGEDTTRIPPLSDMLEGRGLE